MSAHSDITVEDPLYSWYKQELINHGVGLWIDFYTPVHNATHQASTFPQCLFKIMLWQNCLLKIAFIISELPLLHHTVNDHNISCLTML